MRRLFLNHEDTAYGSECVSVRYLQNTRVHLCFSIHSFLLKLMFLLYLSRDGLKTSRHSEAIALTSESKDLFDPILPQVKVTEMTHTNKHSRDQIRRYLQCMLYVHG